MSQTLQASQLLAVPLAPLVGSALAGIFGTRLGGNRFGRAFCHSLTILGVLVAFVLSALTLQSVAWDGARFNETLYTWMVVGGLKMEIGFMIDGLTAMMMCVVTFVSLMVHLYTIGYMQEDEGYNRFFAYISLFTFSMLMLVMSNNLLQLFFGWEAVGLVSYLLIGFWFNKPSAVFANMKAFLVNRVGDFGFILGIGLIAAYAGSLNYTEIFSKAPELAPIAFPGTDWMLVTVICLCLFVGAMGKSAQFPLHVWLPDSMEGPTPISALIHAATSGNPKFFLGTDSAPHARHTKEAACGCAGVYTAHAGIELYAEIFGAYNALDKLENFASVYGPAFYGLPRNTQKITLIKEIWDVPQELPYHKDTLVPFRSGGTVSWRMA